MSKKLVAYFSAGGTTAGAAKKLANAAVLEGKVLNGNLFDDVLRKWVESL